MVNMFDSPSDRFHQSIVNALNKTELSNRAIGLIWSAETDEDPAVCARRVDRLREGLPMQVIDLVCLMDAIGYQVVLKNDRFSGA
jgi:hypothetical protein